MRAAIVALGLALVPLAASCQTFGGLAEPTPATPADELALQALVADLGALALDADQELPEWVSELTTLYAAARAAAGEPIPPPPQGADLIRHRVSALLLELAGGEAGSVLEHDWARSAVRIYAAWREVEGRPIPGWAPPPPVAGPDPALPEP